jgi:demethylmenaquinone methyltransferase/2-methoxy-6-polyprenyl-1,4-benzoquinol methylase
MNLRALQRLFADAAPTYDLVNHVLTWGFDSIWRNRATKLVARGAPRLCLDVCTGTGDLAIGLSRRLGSTAVIAATDLSLPMLDRARRKRGAKGVRFVVADARALPFRDGALDAVSISFATRNINVTDESLDLCLAEFHRVLRPGGRFVNLETSQPRSASLRWLVHRYVRIAVEPIGSLISGSRPAYAYLASSIARFFDAETLTSRIQSAGFSQVSMRRLLWGVAAIHCATKNSQ